MTLICATHHNNVPLLISDLLVSASGHLGHAEIPTYDNVGRLSFVDPAYRVQGLSQKLCILRPSLAVGCADVLIEARGLLKSLDRRLGATPDLDELKQALTEYWEEEPPRVVAVGSLILPEKKFTIFRWDGGSNRFETGPFFSVGSGADSFDRNVKNSSGGIRQTPNASADAAAFAAGLISRFLGQEVLRGENIPFLFGGGFDLVCLEQSGFRHVGRVDQVMMRVARHPEFENVYAWSIFKTVLRQKFETAVEVERIDFGGDKPIDVRRKILLKIKSRKKEAARTLFRTDSDTAKNNIHILLIHVVLGVGDKDFGNAEFPCFLPNKQIEFSVSDTHAAIKLKRPLFERIITEAAKICDTDQIKRMIAIHRERGGVFGLPSGQLGPPARGRRK